MPDTPVAYAPKAHRLGRFGCALSPSADASVDRGALERDKIKGAIRTDFILAAEIIAITLGTVAQATFTIQVLVLSGIAARMTIGVYGLVAGIVKLDENFAGVMKAPCGNVLQEDKYRGVCTPG